MRRDRIAHQMNTRAVPAARPTPAAGVHHHQQEVLLIVMFLKRGGAHGVPHGAAVVASAFPCEAGHQPVPALDVVTTNGRVLGSFRASEVAGFTVESDTEPWNVAP